MTRPTLPKPIARESSSARLGLFRPAALSDVLPVGGHSAYATATLLGVAAMELDEIAKRGYTNYMRVFLK
ncbi:MAG: hypothetical protein QOD07_2969 [Frankiaceae bacterium]|nr:hypothetical protein [Frankiaceae bacterium]